MKVVLRMSETKKSSTSEIRLLAKAYDGLLLEKLGFANVTARGVQQSCPIHEGDNSAAFSYDRKRSCWSCFTHGCHKKFGNDIIGLVMSINKVGFSSAVEWIEEIIYDPECSAGYVRGNIEQYQNLENKTISEDLINKLEKKFDSIAGRGFSVKTLEHFQCGESSEDSKLQHRRLMIPIRNDFGDLIGFTGRSIYDKSERTGSYHPEWANQNGTYSNIFSKWRHYPKGLNKSIELYNFHEAKRYIEKIGFCVLVEGPFDVWRLWEFGVKNCVASYGCSVSKQQVNKLKSIGCKCLCVCFDDDEAGTSGFKKAKTSFTDICIEKICLPINKDPGSLNQKDYNDIIKPQLSVIKNRYANKNSTIYW